MRDLTEEEVLELIGKSVADFSKDIVLFVPSLKFEQPFIMYQSARLGHTKKHLSNDIKLSFDAGMYKYNPKQKPFDITVYEFSDLEVGLADVNGDGIQINMVGGSRPPILNKRDAIAIAKTLGVTAEDLK